MRAQSQNLVSPRSDGSIPPLEQLAPNPHDSSPNYLPPANQQNSVRQQYTVYSGQKTPEENYIVPLLTALVEFGGSARMTPIIDRVGEIMRDQLNEKDWELLPSGKEIRWKNSVQWLRFRLKERGYMSSNTPHGIWGISEKGRQYLRSFNNNLPTEDIL